MRVDDKRIENAVVQATEQNILHHEKWNRKIRSLLWIFILILFVFEGAIALMYCMGMTLSGTHTKAEYVTQYFLIPCFLALFTTAASNLLVSTVFKNRSSGFHSRFTVGTMALVVSEIVALNHGTSVVYVLFIMPVIISVVFLDQATLLFSYISGLVLYLLVVYGYIYPFIPPTAYRHTYMDVLTNIALMTVIYLVCRLLFGRIRELINTAVEQSIRQVELSHELTLDSLTQLYNHATFYEKLDEFILRFKRGGAPFSLLVMDLDNFKHVNDTYGHAAGDAVILYLVDVVKQNIAEGDIAFRYGGEEFTALSVGPEHARTLAENIRQGMEAHVFPEIGRGVTISIGICDYDVSFGGRREFFSAADKALYRAKQGGKNRVCVAEAGAVSFEN